MCKNLFSLKILKRSQQRHHKFTNYKSFQFNSPALTNIETYTEIQIQKERNTNTKSIIKTFFTVLLCNLICTQPHNSTCEMTYTQICSLQYYL